MMTLPCISNTDNIRYSWHEQTIFCLIQQGREIILKIACDDETHQKVLHTLTVSNWRGYLMTFDITNKRPCRNPSRFKREKRKTTS